MGEVGIEPTQSQDTGFTDQPNSPTLALSLVVGLTRLELAPPEGSGFTDQRDYLCHIIPIFVPRTGLEPAHILRCPD